MSLKFLEKNASFSASVITLAILLLLRFTIPEYSQLIYLILFYIALGLSYNVFQGFTNYVCFGYAVFIAMGSYAEALIFKLLANPSISINPFVVVVIGLGLAVVFSVGIGLVVGAIALRLREAYFAIATIGLAQGMRFLIEGFKLWGGSEGLIISRNIIDTYGSNWLSTISTDYADMITFFAAILSIIVTYLLMNSKAGYALQAVREDEDLAKSLGINPVKYKLLAFLLSAILISLVGAGKLLKDQAVFPANAFSLTFTLEAIVITLIGGMGTLLGPFLAGILYAMLKYYLTTLIPGFQLLIMAPIVIAVVELFPRGIIGWIKSKFKGTLIDRLLK
jgi:branched-chain amino acid transport system permease protein